MKRFKRRTRRASHTKLNVHGNKKMLKRRCCEILDIQTL